MAKQIQLTVSPATAFFPAGTVGGPWRFQLTGPASGPDPGPTQVIESATPSAVFAGVAAGDYMAFAVRLSATGAQLGEQHTLPVNVPGVEPPPPTTVSIDVVGGFSASVVDVQAP